MSQPSDDAISDSKMELVYDAMDQAYKAGMRPCAVCSIWGEKELMHSFESDDQVTYLCPTCAEINL